MSASENDIQKQKRRHRGPLIGIILVVAFALALLFWWLTHEVVEGTPPQGADASMDSRTGVIGTQDGAGSVGGTGAGTAGNAPAPAAAPQ